MAATGSLGGAADRWSAAGVVALAGVGTVSTLAGVASGHLPLTIVGALFGAVGLGVLIAARWLDPLGMVVLAIPLPALLSDDTVRVAAVAPVAALAVAAWALGLGTSTRAVRVAGLPRWPLAFLAASFLVAALFSDALGTSARELLNLSVLLGLLVVGVDLLAEDPGKRDRLVTLLAGVAGVTGGLAVLETVGVLPGAFPRSGTPFYRAALGFGQPNALGLFLAMSVPLIAYRRAVARVQGARLAWTLCLAAAALGLVGTFSRASWLAVVFGAGALLMVGEVRTALRIWITTAAVAVAADLVSGGALRDTAVRTVGDWIIEQRAALMLAGVLMFLDHPILGVGPGGFAEQVERYAPLLPQLYDIQPTPHNAFIQMAAEAGIFGLLASVLVLVSLFRVLRGRTLAALGADERRLQLALIWSLAAVGVASLASWPLSHGAGEAIVLVLALACAGAPEREPGAQPAGAGR